METSTIRLIQIVNILQKRFTKLNIKYITIGQSMGKYLYICATEENINEMKKHMLDTESNITLFTKSV